MKAARNFVFGDEDGERHDFAVGDEIPDDIVEELPNHLVLEKLADADPSQLTRDQLLVLAGIGVEDTVDEFNEEEFFESLRNFNDKQALVDWANETMGMELDTSDGTRDELETMVVDFARPEEEEED